MKTTHIGIGKTKSAAFCVGIGVIAALIVSAVLTALLTGLIANEIVGLATQGAFVFAIRMLAIFLGGILGTGFSSGRNLQTIGLIAAVYFVLLLAIGIIFYDGSIRNVVSGLISILLGGVIACAVKLKPQRKKNRALRRMR